VVVVHPSKCKCHLGADRVGNDLSVGIGLSGYTIRLTG
jgi:hypothetical protein